MVVANSHPIQFGKLKKGMRIRIVRTCDDCGDSVRLQEMGLVEGTEFTVVKVAPLGDPVEISLRGYRLCLRKSETKCFELETVE